ncbi:conserved hypothetical protein [Actinacidiphila cocklensis]|uniref:Uncharacterized protein n=1 Tax=Actinacidiphila cocklensis TaxID=887465 RepID=A0A9W4GUK0_9ACTN|nr:conserved hypothetical protein [Actinacidiphila cocklensis]
MTAVTDLDDAEDELRVLLERAVPQLPAPAQRLERVRMRMRRRRRRRTAAVTVSAVLAVAAVVAVPGLVRPQGGGSAPAVVATSGHAVVATTPAGGAKTNGPGTTPPSAGGYRPAGMEGLRLRPPKGWKVLPDPDTDSVFLSSQSLVLPEGGCAHALDGFCTPLARVLASDGVLVMFHLTQSSAQAQKFSGFALPLEDEVPYSACLAVTGTRQMGRTMVGSAGSGTVVWAVACLSHPSAAQTARVRDLIGSADFG